MKPDAPIIRWQSDVAKHDFQAAWNYLSIRFDDATADKLVKDLKKSTITERRANDILRSCNRDPLPLDDPGVLRDLLKVARGEELSPILLVRVSGTEVSEIADGYHRCSLVYRLDAFGTVPLRIA